MASTGRKMSKQERKVWRKQLKMQQTLMKHENIVTLDHPSTNLYIGNGGLGNDVSREDIESLFGDYGAIVDIIMPIRKPYAFISFSSAREAQHAFGNLQETVIRESKHPTDAQVTLYLSFIKSIPGFEVPTHEMPPGLHIIPDFVAENEETLFLETINWNSTDANIRKDSETELKHRKVKHYGYEFLYGINNVDRSKPLEHGIPKEFAPMMAKLTASGYVSDSPDQLTVNQYQPGQGIPPHVDTHSAFTNWIAAVSLGSQCVMDFKHPDGRHVPVFLPRRCCVIMTGESRHLWTHGISPRQSDIIPISVTIPSDAAGSAAETIRLTRSARNVRTSLTFRKLRDGPCNCDFKKQCDSQQNEGRNPELSMPQSENDAFKLEQSHVHKVYDDIAGHFSDTRHTPWPQVAEFLNNCPPGSLVTDVGCGNGKYLGVNPSTIKIGNDRSIKLCEIGIERGFEVFCCDVLSIPFRENVFERAICIAVIHHLSTSERRVAAIKEIIRILCPGGQALLYVWAKEQEKDKKKSNYLSESKIQERSRGDMKYDDKSSMDGVSDTVESAKPDSSHGALGVHVNRTHFESQDLLVPWNLRGNKKDKHEEKEENKGKLYHRYYHVFVEGEIEELVKTISNVKTVRSYYDKGNWCIIIEKL